MIPPSPARMMWPAALLAALVFIVGSLQIARPGYSVDEEFTAFAVRGIHAHGLPRLPSGLLYDRGILYSYASAVIDGRAISLASAALSAMLAFVLVRRHAGSRAALAAAVLVSTSLPFWAAATTARFYAPFLALSLATLTVLGTLGTRKNGTLGTLGTLAALAMAARWIHELAFLFAVVPAVCWLFAREGRRRWLLATLAIVTGLIAGQAVLFLLHALEPVSGETMVRRFFLWQVLNLFERPGERQFAIPLVVAVVALLLAPRRAWWWVVSSLAVSVMILTYSLARASNAEPFTTELVTAVLRDGSRYPLDMFWHLARTTPLTVALALGGLAARVIGAGGEWRAPERAVHLIWIGWVVWFGVIDSGITINYLLLPVTFMLIAVAVDAVAIVEARTRDAGVVPGRTLVWPSVHLVRSFVLALLATAVALDQWRGEGSLLDRLEAARPTIHVQGIDEIRAGLQPNDRVVCTDELGCLMLVGRIDRWLALDDFVRERFLVRRANAPATGVYTGVPAVMRPAEVFSPFDSGDVNRALAQGRALEAGTLPDRTIVVDVFKDFPIGNSRDWLPRAIEQDGLRVVPLLETPQARVLLVSPPEFHARGNPGPTRDRPSGHAAPGPVLRLP